MKFYAVNQFIKAAEMRVVDDTGKQIGVMTKTEALRIAEEKGVDLVEIAPTAKPPVCKVIDFKKFKYLEAKKDREGKAASGKVEIKEIRFSPFIAMGDMNSRLERIKDILGDGDRVKIVVKFTGRQITKVEFGHDLIKKILVNLEGIATADGVAKLQGKQLFIIINPTKKKV
ncbi:MAG: translation initiation factor IF-3 [bacterium]